jgi:dihydroorotate dehydrogenase (NAD+) catalytic subunit
VVEVCGHLPDLAVVGCGGIGSADDARSVLAAGAVAVQVGTALLHDPTTVARMIDDLSLDPWREPV